MTPYILVIHPVQCCLYSDFLLGPTREMSAVFLLTEELGQHSRKSAPVCCRAPLVGSDSFRIHILESTQMSNSSGSPNQMLSKHRGSLCKLYIQVKISRPLLGF